MEPFAVKFITKNHPEDTSIMGYFSSKENAIKYCQQRFKDIKPSYVSELLPIDSNNYLHYERFEYISSGYQCTYQLIPIKFDILLITSKPVIKYNYIETGENKGKCLITADGVEIEVIPFQTAVPFSNLSWQEFTYYEVKRIADEKFPYGYIFPYYIDQGSGYVHFDQLMIDKEFKTK